MKTLRDSGVVLPSSLNFVQGWQQWRPFIKQFGLIIVLLSMVAGLALFAYEFRQLDVEHELLMEQEATRVRLAKQELSTELNTAFSDLEILSKLPALKKVLDNNPTQSRKRLVEVHQKQATLTLLTFLLVLAPIAWLLISFRARNHKADVTIKRIAAEEQALGHLLRLSLQSMEMKDFLQQVMETLVSSVPWLNLLPKGAVFLTEDQGKGKILKLAANYQTVSERQSVCPEVAFGECLCGLAAESRKIQFATRGGRIQEKCIPEMVPHQVYNVPILSEGSVFGVLLLYLPDGYRQDNHETAFLHKVADVLSMGIKLRYKNDSLVHAKENAEAASEQLLGITRNLPGIIFRRILKTDGQVEYFFMNADIAALSDYTQDQLHTGAPLNPPFVDINDHQRLTSAFQCSAEQLEPVDLEYRMVLGSGGCKWVHCCAQPQRQSSGNILWDGLILDISELKDARAELTALTHQLQEQNHELTKSNKELDDFAYIASHDLKEPLRGIHNYSIFLLEDYEDRLDEQGRHMLQTLTRLTRRMECLIDSLLHFSRLGRTEMAMEEVSLQTAVEDVLESLSYSLEERGVEIRIPEKLPTVYCDSARVGEIYRNLITNAMKYNDKPKKWIEIGYQKLVGGADNVDCQDSNIVFHVRDNGIGIEQKHQESIFRIFKRLHGRYEFGGGSGAGLTIAQKIVERHQGCISVESILGDGATFYFTLGDISGKGKSDHLAH